MGRVPLSLDILKAEAIMRSFLLSLVFSAAVLGSLAWTSSPAGAAPPYELPYGSDYPSYYGVPPMEGSIYYPRSSYFPYGNPSLNYGSMYTSYYYGAGYSYAPAYAPPPRYYWTPDGWARAW